MLQLLSVFSADQSAKPSRWSSSPRGRTETCDVVDGLASLVDKSLVEQRGRATAVQRLSMLETIREYAAERLEEEPEIARQRDAAHADYFADLARSSAIGCRGRRARTNPRRARRPSSATS